jgi:membrane protein
VSPLRHPGSPLFRAVSGSLPWQILRKFDADDGVNWTIVIAWNGLLAIFPITLVLAAATGFVLGHLGLGAEQVSRLVLTAIPNDVGAQQQALQATEMIRQRSGLLATVALIWFLWSASGLFGGMEAAFDRAYRIPRRPFPRQKLMALLMMGIFTVLVLAGVGASTLLPLLSRLPLAPLALHGVGSRVFAALMGVVSGTLLFFLFYLVVPNRRLSWREVWPGALFSGVAFELETLLFPLYTQLNPNIGQYGRYFAFLFILLAFFYLFGLITMLGIELNAVLAEQR